MSSVSNTNAGNCQDADSANRTNAGNSQNIKSINKTYTDFNICYF